jgi:hypothetical protein
MATVTEALTPLYSGDLRADALMHPFANWNYVTPEPGRAADTLYFTFTVAASDASEAPDHSPLPFNAAQQAAARAILDYAGQVTGIHFVETSSALAADFHFADADLTDPNTLGLTSTGWSYSDSNGLLTSFSANAYVYLDDAEWAGTNIAPVAGNSAYETLLHEVGHALGLDHPFDGPFSLPADQDNTNNTVMSYHRAGGPKSAFQTDDLLALYWIYGGDGLGGLRGYNSVAGPTLAGAGANVIGIRSVGTPGVDGLIGTAGNDTLIGLGGNDFFFGDAGDDHIDGGPGIDRAMYTGSSWSFVFSHSPDGLVVRDTTGAQGIDTLVGVERLQFDDGLVAIDLDGHAGTVARIIGALFGKAMLARSDYVGVGLSLLDGGMSDADLAALAVHTDIFAHLAGSRSNTDFVKLVYRNVVGTEADAPSLAYFVGQLDHGEATQASMALMAAETDLCAQQIDLVGLSVTGLPYFPM